MDAKMDVKKDGKKMQQTAFYENVQQHQVQRHIVHQNWEKNTLKSGAKFDAKSSFCCSVWKQKESPMQLQRKLNGTIGGMMPMVFCV